jgi:hypothetical protein
MSEKNHIQIPDKGVWNSVKSAKNQKVNHLMVTAGEDTTIVDTPLAINLRIIPRVFTAPLQAVGLVTSIFARMLNTKITLHLNDDKD